MKKLYLKLRLYIACYIEVESAFNDIRKFGMMLVGAGFLGFVIHADKVSYKESAILILVGVIAWVIGLHKVRTNK